MKCIEIRQDEYERLQNIGMVCFELKEETNVAIQDLWGECRLFLRSVTAFGLTKISAQILIDQLIRYNIDTI